MKRSRFSEEQIIGGGGRALPQAWDVVGDLLCVEGMDVSDAKRLKARAEENAKLRRLDAPKTRCAFEDR